MDVGAYNTYDGDGRLAKRVDRKRNPAGGNTTWYEAAEYTIFSSVTGNAISELDHTGARTKLSVYMGGSVIAEHANTGFSFKHADPVTGATKQTDDDGLVNPSNLGRSNPEAFGAKHRHLTENRAPADQHKILLGSTIGHNSMVK